MAGVQDVTVGFCCCCCSVLRFFGEIGWFLGLGDFWLLFLVCCFAFLFVYFFNLLPNLLLNQLMNLDHILPFHYFNPCTILYTLAIDLELQKAFCMKTNLPSGLTFTFAVTSNSS